MFQYQHQFPQVHTHMITENGLEEFTPNLRGFLGKEEEIRRLHYLKLFTISKYTVCNTLEN